MTSDPDTLNEGRKEVGKGRVVRKGKIWSPWGKREKKMEERDWREGGWREGKEGGSRRREKECKVNVCQEYLRER